MSVGLAWKSAAKSNEKLVNQNSGQSCCPGIAIGLTMVLKRESGKNFKKLVKEVNPSCNWQLLKVWAILNQNTVLIWIPFKKELAVGTFIETQYKFGRQDSNTGRNIDQEWWGLHKLIQNL